MDGLGGTAIGCWGVLAAVRAMVALMAAVAAVAEEAVVTREATVAGTDWTVPAGGSCPTETHRAVPIVIKTSESNSKSAISGGRL